MATVEVLRKKLLVSWVRTRSSAPRGTRLGSGGAPPGVARRNPARRIGQYWYCSVMHHWHRNAFSTHAHYSHTSSPHGIHDGFIPLAQYLPCLTKMTPPVAIALSVRCSSLQRSGSSSCIRMAPAIFFLTSTGDTLHDVGLEE